MQQYTDFVKLNIDHITWAVATFSHEKLFLIARASGPSFSSWVADAVAVVRNRTLVPSSSGWQHKPCF